MDDVIHSEDYDSHVKFVRSVLQTLNQRKLFGKLSKCEFHKEEMAFLSCCILGEEQKMDPRKVQDIIKWALPETRRQLQSFIGYANFYRDFIPNFTTEALPLTDLQKQRVKDLKVQNQDPNYCGDPSVRKHSTI